MSINLILSVIIIITSSYLLGSINFAIIITKIFTKKDIRDFGSGNAGMTNVLRSVGKFPAALTLLGDFGKGVLAVFIGKILIINLGGMISPSVGVYFAAFFVLLGHIYPIYYKFKGGKGILTTAGALLMIDPISLLICVIVFAIVCVSTRIVSLSSICCAVAYPVATFIVRVIQKNANIWLDTIMAIFIAGIIIFMHRSNIKRLINGTEHKFGKK